MEGATAVGKAMMKRCLDPPIQLSTMQTEKTGLPAARDPAPPTPPATQTILSVNLLPNGANGTPWQLEMFDVSLKKQQKLAMLVELLGPLTDQRCLLITHGDNPGSLNYHLRAEGGRWSWAEMDEDGIPQMEQLLREEVRAATPELLPFDDESFDRVVVVDVHEHLHDVRPLNAEIARVLAPEAVAIVTTPSGDPRLPVSVLKRWIGMGNPAYGHVVQGYRTEELAKMLLDVGLKPVGHGLYSRFFTEIAELAINFGYVKVLGRRRSGAPAGEIAPRTEDDLRSVNRTYRIYRTVFPLIRTFSALDALVPGSRGYAVAVAAQKDGLRAEPVGEGTAWSARRE
jgi:SAM-dependent methyltransferase